MKSLLLGLTLSALAATSVPALSAPSFLVHGDIAVTKDGIAVHTSRSSAPGVPGTPPPGKLVTIFDNLARKYPSGLYNAITARNITGTQNTLNFPEYRIGTAFTPAADHTVTQIQIPLAAWIGTNAAIVGLYADSAGLPGTPIKEWHVENMMVGGCCELVTVRSKGGIPVTAGHQYWVVVRADSTKGNDQDLAWYYNVTDQITPSSYAYYCKDTATKSCGSPSGVWQSNSFPVALALSVHGSD